MKQNRKGKYMPLTKKTARKHRRTLLIRLVILAILIVAVRNTKFSGASELTHLVEAADENKQNKVTTEKTETGAMKNYTNIVLFGVDSTQGEIKNRTRTDTIIIASVNNKNGEVKLVSVYRDTFLNIGEDVYTKCNAAYAKGGPARAIQMLNSNLDLNISDFVTIGFGGLAAIIDDIGGITLDITEEEMVHLNNYQTTMAEELGLPLVPLTQSGEQVVNGVQAVAYCRIRYTAGNDFKRTERQRTVLAKTISGIKHASPVQMLKVANDILNWTYMSLDTGDIAGLLTKVLDLNISETAGFPASDMITTANLPESGSCVIPVTLSSNVTRLHEFLFGETGYQPGETVEAYSQEIRRQSGQ